MKDQTIPVSDAVVENGTIRILKTTLVRPSACPFFIFSPEHYREDGTCKCNDPEHRKMMIREWGYKARDFKSIPLAKGGA